MEVKSSKEDLIRNAVLDTVAEVGLAGLTMKKIATLADISPATLYLYYSNKEEMINRLYRETKE
jgi:TetR/AcrR family transcriptional regulator, repressor of fatR-cypB operon